MYPLQKYRSTRILLGLLAKPVSMGIVASAGAILCSPTASSAANFNLNAGNNNSGVFNFTGEIDNVTISTTGLYALDVFGAEGGSNGFFRTGGKGDKAKGNISLDAGTILSILVGQRGENGRSGSNGGTFGGGGGGGASFVVTVLNGTPTPLITAGGGGGGIGSFGVGGFGGGLLGGNGGFGGLSGINGGFLIDGSSVGGFGGNGGFGGGDGGIGGNGNFPGLGGGGGRGISFINGIPTTIDGGISGSGRFGSDSNIPVLTSSNQTARVPRGDGAGLDGQSGFNGNFSDVFVNSNTNSGDGRVSISLISSPTAVPEPLTIIGTIIGGTAAMRLRKRLKSTGEE